MLIYSQKKTVNYIRKKSSDPVIPGLERDFVVTVDTIILTEFFLRK